MKCNKCNHNISLKETTQFLSLLCKCEIIIIYPDKIIKTITKTEYENNKKCNP